MGYIPLPHGGGWIDLLKLVHHWQIKNNENITFQQTMYADSNESIYVNNRGFDYFFVQLAQLFQFDKIPFWCQYTDRIWQDIGLFPENGLVCG